MSRKLFLLLLVLAVALVIVAPAYAAVAPLDCSSGQGYAQNHIVPTAHDGDLGKVDHDGDGAMHVPGAHHGFSACNPSGK